MGVSESRCRITVLLAVTVVLTNAQRTLFPFVPGSHPLPFGFGFHFPYGTHEMGNGKLSVEVNGKDDSEALACIIIETRWNGDQRTMNPFNVKITASEGGCNNSKVKWVKSAIWPTGKSLSSVFMMVDMKDLIVNHLNRSTQSLRLRLRRLPSKVVLRSFETSNKESKKPYFVIYDLVEEGECFRLIPYNGSDSHSIAISLQKNDLVQWKMKTGVKTADISALILEDYNFCDGTDWISGTYSLDDHDDYDWIQNTQLLCLLGLTSCNSVTNESIHLKLKYNLGHNATLTLKNTLLLSLDCQYSHLEYVRPHKKSEHLNNLLCSDPWFYVRLTNTDSLILNCGRRSRTKMTLNDPSADRSINLAASKASYKNQYQQLDIVIYVKLLMFVIFMFQMGLAELEIQRKRRPWDSTPQVSSRVLAVYSVGSTISGVAISISFFEP